MLAAVAKGEYIQDASEGGRGLFAPIANSFEVCGGEFGEEAPEPCFNGELQNQDLLKLMHLDLVVCLSFALSNIFLFFFLLSCKNEGSRA